MIANGRQNLGPEQVPPRPTDDAYQLTEPKEPTVKPDKKPKLGSGARFAALKNKLAGKAKDPGALAAYIGRQRYGKAAFQAMATKGRERAEEEKD